MQLLEREMLKVLLASFVIAAVSEMGDKTQWLAMSLAARSGRPGMICAGIFAGVLLNHAVVSWFGNWIARHVSHHGIAAAAGLLFIAFGLWALRPERIGGFDKRPRSQGFIAIAALFFLTESGDKTQLATMALSARFHSTWIPALGTTLGTLASDALAMIFGAAFLRRLPAKALRLASAGVFFSVGMLSFWSAV